MAEANGPVVWRKISRISESLSVVSGVATTLVMLLTVVDVLGRAVKHPVVGSYEMIGLTGAIIIGFSMPFTTTSGSHVFMEILVNRLPRRIATAMNIATRTLCIILFAVAGVNVFRFAGELARAGEVSPTLKVPVYPFTYIFGICCFLQCLVFVFAIVRHFEKEEEQS
jgi:TRAP-type C4-dicarboxylate transport system permease small subunit